MPRARSARDTCGLPGPLSRSSPQARCWRLQARGKRIGHSRRALHACGHCPVAREPAPARRCSRAAASPAIAITPTLQTAWPLLVPERSRSRPCRGSRQRLLSDKRSHACQAPACCSQLKRVMRLRDAASLEMFPRRAGRWTTLARASSPKRSSTACCRDGVTGSSRLLRPVRQASGRRDPEVGLRVRNRSKRPHPYACQCRGPDGSDAGRLSRPRSRMLTWSCAAS